MFEVTIDLSEVIRYMAEIGAEEEESCRLEDQVQAQKKE